VVIEEAFDEAGDLFLRRRQLIGRHRRDGRPRQHSIASVPPVVQEHPGERRVVVDGRHETAAT
jgi:hypothetical protein